ncbi:hypothetical protein V2J09_010902 [Rumex salicifolius]
MNCTIWNDQGAGSKGFCKACNYLLHKYRTDILVLMETRVSEAKAQEVCMSLGFSNNFRVEAIGYADGIWVLWNDSNVLFQIMRGALEFILFGFMRRLLLVEGASFGMLLIYSGPLFVGGDFNCIISVVERMGGSGQLSPDSHLLTELVSRQDLVDIGYVGSQFTWSQGARGNPVVSKRLNRVFSNVMGRLKWDSTIVKHLPTTRSDHNPLYLSLSPMVQVISRPSPNSSYGTVSC